MTETPGADRPHYSTGAPVESTIDKTTREYNRGVNPATGAKTTEPAEPGASLTSVSPTSGPTAGGTAVTLTGDNFGGSTGATFGGTAATAFTVVSETEITCTTPGMGVGGAKAIVVQNPQGNSAEAVNFTAT